ncbi:MAG: PQQ-dependent sugar dehydrogenase [Acidimicrobiia bacterium]
MRSRLATVVAVATLVAFAACQPKSPPPAPPAPPGSPTPPGVPTLTKQVLMSNLSQPWDLAFTPNDGTMLFTEKSGAISAYLGGVKRQLGTVSDVRVMSEGGLLGMAIHPDYGSGSNFIYVCYASRSNDVRVVRFTVDLAYPADSALSVQTPIVTGMPWTSGRHSGCRPRFGSDGMLWITTGDSATGIVPVDLDSLGGKVLRIEADGNAAPDNPDLGGDDRIYTYGHRNVQGIAFQPGTGQAYSVEHGPGRDDEINRLIPGGNYGWDGDNNNNSIYEESVPMTDTGQFPSAVGAVWSSGSPTIAPSGATFLSGAQWGSWDGALAVAVLKDMRLRVFLLNGAGTEVIGFTDVLREGLRLRVAVQGPDGNLYVATDASGSSGQIWKVVPS